MLQEAETAHHKPQQQVRTRRGSSARWDTETQDLSLSFQEKRFFSRAQGRGMGKGIAGS